MASETRALEDIGAERARQISEEGCTPEHDDGHTERELCRAAACYAVGHQFPDAMAIYFDGEDIADGEPLWPWGDEWWKPADTRRNLVKAGALIVAEIERLDRAAARGEAP